MEEQHYDYGMIGLGTMGRNLVYNMCDHGYSVAGFDKDISKVDTLEKEKGNYKIHGSRTTQEFIASLKQPRVILLLVPAGQIVDSVVEELKPLLSKDDLIMDCGNSHFTDTNRRLETLAKENIHFMGVGVSGGESGARYGPSIMPGGSKEAYQRIATMLEAVSAKAKGEPCVTFLGTGSAGHYVKMVHNGIEYALMQLISEAYHLMKVGVGMNNDELHTIFSKWDEGILQSFLISITADIFAQQDDLTTNRLIDVILDSAKQNGTGAWTSQDSMSQLIPIPVIDTAVSVRDLSALKEERQIAHQKLQGPNTKFTGDKKEFVDTLENALYFSMITTYAQGMALLHQASITYKYELKLHDIASIWRGGCIIRAALLDDIRSAFIAQPTLSNIILNDVFAKKLNVVQKDARQIIKTGIELGIPMPAFMSSLFYYDCYRSGWLPANLIQAQRDYFGAHTYERTDRKGIFHTHWNQNKH
jgi:6-phosphogluconate dehydrogenase